MMHFFECVWRCHSRRFDITARCGLHTRRTANRSQWSQWTGCGHTVLIAAVLSHHIASPFCASILKPNLNRSKQMISLISWSNCVEALVIAQLTCNTRFDSPVFCDNCFRSLASGFWLMAKYDFIVRNWWCLNDVRIRLLRACCERLPPEPGDWLPSYDKSNDVAVKSVCMRSKVQKKENNCTNCFCLFLRIA